MRKLYYGTCFLSVVVAAGFILAHSAALGAGTRRAGQTPKPLSPAYKKLLTVADVESATSIKALKLVPPGSVEDAAGDLNFAQSDGSMLLMVSFGDASVFKAWKAQEGNFSSAVKDIGDEAFNGPKVKAPYVLFVRKGNRAFSLSSFLNTDTGKPLLSQDQLRSLTKIILSRL